ncbi:MAG TPA: hypothetical protein VHQ65_13160 [Thermoanaerobaculia bacterium]|nr:hypothetical protein [Thermoanaerobaculia bacterium]
MNGRRTRPLALLLLLALPASAECLRVEGVPDSWWVEIEIDGCRPVAEVADARLGTVGLDWVRRAVRSHVEGELGVVLTGRVLERLGVEALPSEAYLLHGKPETVDVEGTWFLPRTGSAPCTAFAPGSVVELYQPSSCCCAYPPYQLHCVLEIDRLAPVPASLAALVGSDTAAP